MKWGFIGYLLILLALGCSPQLQERAVLPTVVVGAPSDGSTTPTRESPIPTLDGPISTPATWATALPTPLPPPAPQIPHAIEGNEDCRRCHLRSSEIALPSDHASRDVNICRGCHAVDEGWLPTAVPVPHIVAGREACLICHLQGTNGAKSVPGDHAGRGNQSCLECHRQD